MFFISMALNFKQESVYMVTSLEDALSPLFALLVLINVLIHFLSLTRGLILFSWVVTFSIWYLVGCCCCCFG